DVGMLMTARNQAQNAADAGALAGAISLAFNSYTDRSSSGPAVQAAINAAAANKVIGARVSVNAGDLNLPLSPTGLDHRVQVNAFRTAERSNPVPTLMGTLFGLNNVDVSTTATAEAAPADAATCVMPFTIPDKWKENQDPGGWTPQSDFQMYDKQGNVLPNADVYTPGKGGTGYTYDDKGLQLVLK